MEDNKNLEEQTIETEETTQETTENTETVDETQNTEEVQGDEEAVEVIDETEEAGEKKGLFGKKKDKKDELIADLTDKYKRTFAEFDNFRKRSEKEKSEMFEVGAKSVIEKILPVVDNFERGLNTLSEEEKEQPFAQGMDKIYKQLLATLNDLGVTEIEADGAEFDPNLHNAVMHVEDEELGENVVAEVLLKGYKYRDSVVRHSMVKVAN